MAEMIQMNTEMTSKSYVVGEIIQLRILLENPGSSVIRVPDPLLNESSPNYLITEPDGTHLTINLCKARIPNPMHDPEVMPAQDEMELPPKGKWSAEIPLNPMFEPTKIGQYKIQVALDVDTTQVRGPEMQFELRPANIVALTAVPEQTESAGLRLIAAWAHVDDTDAFIVEETRLGGLWDNSRLGRLYTTRIDKIVDSSIALVDVPEMPTRGGMDFTNWLVWTEDTAIRVQRAQAGTVLHKSETLLSGEGNWALAGHPVMDSAHNLRVFAIKQVKGQATFYQAGIDWDKTGSAAIHSSVILPFMPSSSTVVHSRGDKRDYTVTFCVGQGKTGTSLIMIRSNHMATVEEVATFGQDVVLPGQPLDACETSSGKVAIVCLVRPGDKPDALRVYTIPVDGKQKPVISSRDIELPADISTETIWCTISATPESNHLLWLDGSGNWWYGTEHTGPARLSLICRTNPPPRFIFDGAIAYLVVASNNGAFQVLKLADLLTGEAD
jgi:hypothetical protein